MTPAALIEELALLVEVNGWPTVLAAAAALAKRDSEDAATSFEPADQDLAAKDLRLSVSLANLANWAGAD